MANPQRKQPPDAPIRLVARRAHAPDAYTVGASVHAVGTSHGIHPEDTPSLTEERRANHQQPVYEDEEDDDQVYNVRPPTSVRRYHAPVTNAPTRTMMRVTRHQGPPPRASRLRPPAAQAPAPPPPQRTRAGLHPTVYIGAAMLVMLVGWILLSSLSQWWQVQHDTWQYGTPRTFQIDADVKHGGVSHFLVVNLHGHIVITEMQVNRLQATKVYSGPVFSGAGTDLQPATIHFKDANGDGYPDLVIAVGSGRYLLLNDHAGFRPATSSDRVIGGID